MTHHTAVYSGCALPGTEESLNYNGLNNLQGKGAVMLHLTAKALYLISEAIVTTLRRRCVRICLM